MKFLVIAAHPDDEVLGCGASMAKWIKAGHEGQVMILGEGVASRGGDDVSAQKAVLYKCAETANGILGMTKPEIFDLPDNRFDSVDLLDIVQLIEKKIKGFQPDRILTHFSGDLNLDHSITHRAVLTATRPMKGQSVKEIWAFEVNSATEWGFGQIEGRSFNPQIFEEVTASIDLKIEAMAAYEAEAREWPHPRSSRALKALSDYRGSASGCDAAEAFELIRQVVN